MRILDRILDFFVRYWVVLLTIAFGIAIAISSVQIYREEILNVDPTLEYTTQDTLYFTSERIDTLNPIISQSEDVYYLSKLIYSSLFRYDENLNVEPDLVDSYTIDTNRAFIEIKLKKNVRWHDGTNITAEDVAFTVNAIRSVGTNSVYFSNVSKIASAFAKKKNVVHIYFKNNYNCSLDDLTFPIVPAKEYDNITTFITKKEGFKPIGTGEYRYKSYDKRKQLNLIPNNEYYGKVSDKKICVNILPDKSLSSNLVEINSATCYFDDTVNRKSKAIDKKYVIYDMPSNNVDFLVFNTRKALLKAKAIRKAICYSIDTEKLIDDAYMGDGILCDTIYYPNFLGVSDTQMNYIYNFDKAKELLKKSGFNDINEDSILEDRNGKPLKFEILVNKNNTARNSAAKFIKKNLEQIGVKSKITSLPKKDYEKAIRYGQFDILVTGFSIEQGYDLRHFFDGKNDWGYYDYTLLTKARELDRLYNPSKYKEAFEELKKVLVSTAQYYPLCYKKMSLIGTPTFEAKELPMFNNLYKNCDTWSWKIVTVKGEDKENKAVE